MATDISLPNAYTAATVAAGFIAAYCLLGIIYRLCFHPLAKFPGPRLAAATLWYEFYFDCILYGQYTFKIGQMHEKYGLSAIQGDQMILLADRSKAQSSALAQTNFIAMIPTLYPHCEFPLDFVAMEYLSLCRYAGAGSRRDKSKFYCDAGAMPGSTVFTVGHDVSGDYSNSNRTLLDSLSSQLHRMRRAQMSSFFSKASVRRLEPLVGKTVDKLTDALQTHRNSGEPVLMSSAYSGFAIDVITDYCFAKSYNLLDDQTFQKSMHHAFSRARSGMHWIRHFPRLFDVLKWLPR